MIENVARLPTLRSTRSEQLRRSNVACVFHGREQVRSFMYDVEALSSSRLLGRVESLAKWIAPEMESSWVAAQSLSLRGEDDRHTRFKFADSIARVSPILL